MDSRNGVFLSFSASGDEVRTLVRKLHDNARDISSDDELVHKLILAAEEILDNIVRHGNTRDGGAVVNVEVVKEPDRVSIVIADAGPPFNPLEQPVPDVKSHAESRKVGGLGLFIARNMVDTFEYRRVQGKNVVQLTQVIPS